MKYKGRIGVRVVSVLDRVTIPKTHYHFKLDSTHTISPEACIPDAKMSQQLHLDESKAALLQKEAEVASSADFANGSFPLMKLPAEVRNIVYEFAITTTTIHPRRINLEPSRRSHVWQFFAHSHYCINSSSPTTNLLFTNRQIYEEALCVLYDRGRILIEICPTNVTFLSTEDEPCLDVITKYTFRLQMKHLEIEISWRDIDWDTRNVIVTSLQLICDALEGFAALETVTIRWRPYFTQTWSCGKVKGDGCGPGRGIALSLLQPLWDFNKSSPAVRIEVWTPPELLAKESVDEGSGSFGKYTELGAYSCELE